jgi:hypothetical protein
MTTSSVVQSTHTRGSPVARVGVRRSECTSISLSFEFLTKHKWFPSFTFRDRDSPASILKLRNLYLQFIEFKLLSRMNELCVYNTNKWVQLAVIRIIVPRSIIYIRDRIEQASIAEYIRQTEHKLCTMSYCYNIIYRFKTNVAEFERCEVCKNSCLMLSLM